MMQKKVAGLVVVLLSGTVFASCASQQTLATYDGGKITQEALYERMKEKTGSQTLASMVILNLLESEYPEAATPEKVNEEYQKMEEQSGGAENFKTVLANNKYTKETMKSEYIKPSLLYQALLDDHLKITDQLLKSEWDNSLNFSIIAVASKSSGENILKKLKKGEDFGILAAANSKDQTAANQGVVGWYNTSVGTAYDARVITAAKKLKDGELSELLDVDGAYYIIKMGVNPSTTSQKMSKYKDELKTIIENRYRSDGTYMSNLVGKLVKKADVKIDDKDMKDALKAYIGGSTSTTTTKK